MTVPDPSVPQLDPQRAHAFADDGAVLVDVGTTTSRWLVAPRVPGHPRERVGDVVTPAAVTDRWASGLGVVTDDGADGRVI